MMNIKNSFKVMLLFASFFCTTQNACASCDETVSDLSHNSTWYEKFPVHLDEEDRRYVLQDLQKDIANIKEYLEADAITADTESLEEQDVLKRVGYSGSQLRISQDTDDFVQKGLAGLFYDDHKIDNQDFGLVDLLADEKNNEK